jgi:hypothetical protein
VVAKLRRGHYQRLDERDGEVSTGVADVVQRALSLDASDRYVSADALKKALEESRERIASATEVASVVRTLPAKLSLPPETIQPLPDDSGAQLASPALEAPRVPAIPPPRPHSASVAAGAQAAADGVDDAFDAMQLSDPAVDDAVATDASDDEEQAPISLSDDDLAEVEEEPAARAPAAPGAPARIPQPAAVPVAAVPVASGPALPPVTARDTTNGVSSPAALDARRPIPRAAMIGGGAVVCVLLIAILVAVGSGDDETSTPAAPTPSPPPPASALEPAPNPTPSEREPEPETMESAEPEPSSEPSSESSSEPEQDDDSGKPRPRRKGNDGEDDNRRPAYYVPSDL